MNITGNQIVAFRQRHRLSQRQLAKLCDVTAETLSRLESNNAIAPGYIDMIVYLLGLDDRNIMLALDRRAEELKGKK